MTYNYEEIHKRYSMKKEELVFSKEEIIKRLTSKFNAEEIFKEEILDLPMDDHFEYDKIFFCLKIVDEKILDEIFNDDEKRSHKEEKKDNKRSTKKRIKTKDLSETKYNKLLIDEQEGKRVDIILESKDGKYVSEFQVRSHCEYLNRYLNALIVGAQVYNSSIDFEEDINDYYFKFYLENIEDFKFLT